MDRFKTTLSVLKGRFEQDATALQVALEESLYDLIEAVHAAAKVRAATEGLTDKKANEKAKVLVLIDEYDKPLSNTWENPEEHKKVIQSIPLTFKSQFAK